MSDAHKGIAQSQESINKRMLKMIGQKRSDETKLLLSKINKGKKFSEEFKSKLSKSAKNRTLSEKTKLEMSKKMSIAKSKPRKQYKLLSPDNYEYIFDGLKSVFEFAKDNGISITLLKNFKNKGKLISKAPNTEYSSNWEFISL